MRKRHFYWMMVTIISGILSCTPLDCNLTGDCAEPMSGERIDIHISGHLDLQYHEEATEDGSLVDLLIPSYPPYANSFLLKLPDDRELRLTIVHKHLTNSWQYPSIPFDIFPSSILDNKIKYVEAELIGKTPSAQYVSHISNLQPKDITLDVFHVVDQDGQWLRARVTNLILYQLEAPENKLSIQGTFVSAIPNLPY